MVLFPVWLVKDALPMAAEIMDTVSDEGYCNRISAITYSIYDHFK